MNKILNCIANKAICAAFVVFGAMSVCAAGTRVNLTDGNGNVIGYKVYGLGDNKNETAVVFTKAGAEIPWTVPAYLENVQFLVVAGGGGGGGAANNGLSAGAGGGGGGVVTGVIKSLTKGQKLAVMVGEGGEGGSFTDSNSSGAGAAKSAGQKSYFKLNAKQDVTAYGGGRDLGVYQYSSTGGSRGGNRHNGNQGSGANKGVISNSTDIVNIKLYGNFGGNSDSYWHCLGAGGGGGAIGQGGGRTLNPYNDKTKEEALTHNLKGGHGGAGLASDITGDAIVYGSGGGGGTTGPNYGNLDTGKAGVGAGDGAIAYEEANGTLTVIRSYEGNTTEGNGGSGAPNQGGGGGGGAYGDGGNGGSGIVVFRYVDSSVACIGETGYETLEAAFAAAQAGETITLVKDIELTTFVSIARSLTLDLNGKKINRADGTALYVNGDATVKIQGEGSVSGAQAVYVGAGTVVIKGGNFHGYNGGHAVYVQGTGNVEILDGTFSIDPSGSYDYVLNKYDADRETTSIVVKGGKFKGFNPADNGAEGANTNFCAANYRAEADGEWYVVKEGCTLTVEKPVVTVQTEEAANAVQLNVVAPDGLTEAQKKAYLGYFEKKITPEGSGFKVELALVDEVKPIIAETTPAITFDDDGTVTVNIENKLPGLNYGVRYATTVEAVEAAKIVPGLTVTPAEGDTAGFFKVVVDFKEIQ